MCDSAELHLLQLAYARMGEPNEGPVMSLQRAPCGLDNQSSSTVTTQEEHEERLLYMVKFFDAKIRAEVLHETAASSFLREHLKDKSMIVRTRNTQDE